MDIAGASQSPRFILIIVANCFREESFRSRKKCYNAANASESMRGVGASGVVVRYNSSGSLPASNRFLSSTAKTQRRQERILFSWLGDLGALAVKNENSFVIKSPRYENG